MQKNSADGRFCLIEGVVGRAHERAGLDVLETHLFAEALVLREFIGVDETNDRQMIAA